MPNKSDNTVVLENVKLWYPSFTEVIELSKKYQVNIATLNKSHIKSLEKVGLGSRVRSKDNAPEQGDFIVAKSIRRPEVIDEEGRDMNSASIGWGSTATVVVNAYTSKKYPGTFAGLQKVTITDLIEYESASEDTSSVSADDVPFDDD